MASFLIARARPEPFPDQPATISGFKAAIDNTDRILTKAPPTHWAMEDSPPRSS
jgi:hypothetical protein